METTQTDNPDFVKDTKSGGLLNTNAKSLAAYKAQKAKAARIDELEARQFQLMRELSDLRKIVDRLLDKTPRAQ